MVLRYHMSLILQSCFFDQTGYQCPAKSLKNIMRDTVCRRFLHHIVLSYYIWDNVCGTFIRHIVVSYYIKATDVKKMVTRFVINYYILPIDVNAVEMQSVVITTFCNITTFWVATVHATGIATNRTHLSHFIYIQLITIILNSLHSILFPISYSQKSVTDTRI